MQKLGDWVEISGKKTPLKMIPTMDTEAHPQPESGGSSHMQIISKFTEGNLNALRGPIKRREVKIIRKLTDDSVGEKCSKKSDVSGEQDNSTLGHMVRFPHRLSNTSSHPACESAAKNSFKPVSNTPGTMYKVSSLRKLRAANNEHDQPEHVETAPVQVINDQNEDQGQSRIIPNKLAGQPKSARNLQSMFDEGICDVNNIEDGEDLELKIKAIERQIRLLTQSKQVLERMKEQKEGQAISNQTTDVGVVGRSH